MPLCKIPNFGFGQLRAKLASAARKVVKSKRDASAGPNTNISTSIPSDRGSSEERSKLLSLLSSPATASKLTAVSTKPSLATTSPRRTIALVIAPTSTEAAHQLGFLENSPAASKVCSQIGMTPLEQPWSSRRRSSLMRVSASNMQMSDELRLSCPVANRQYEYVPPTIDNIPVTSEGIEMEMDEFVRRLSAGSQKVSFEVLDDADDNASMLTFEYVSFLMVHHANPYKFTPASRNPQASAARTPTSFKASIDLGEVSASNEAHTSSPQRSGKLRPAPLPIFSTEFTIMQPLPVQEQFCIMSDSPLSFRSMAGAWPDTPDSIRIVLRPSTARSSVSVVRPGTADSNGSVFQSVYW